MTTAAPHQVHLLPEGAAGTLYLMPGAFSQGECAEWIRSTEARGYTATGGSYPADYRDNDRLLFDDPALAEVLFERLRGRIPPELERDGARWRLSGLNQRFRCCRYGGGQRFAIHRDGPYAPGPGERSWLTLMLYLNDAAEFEGGETSYYADRSGREELASIRPGGGDLVVFSHDLWHAGQPVTAGRKYVLRTDVLYERVSLPGAQQSRPTLPGARAVLTGHQSYVWSVVALPDGRIASAGRDGTIRIWTAEGEELQVLRGAWRSLTTLAATAGGLWAGRRDGGVQRFEPDASGALHPVLELHPPQGAGPILAMSSLAEEGVLLADAEGRLSWLDRAGQLQRRVSAHAGWIWALARHQQGWATGGADGILREWSPEGVPLAATNLGEPIRALAGLGQGRLALGLAGGEVWLWDAEGRRRLGRHEGIVRSLLPLPGGRLASAGEDDRVRIWCLDSENLSCEVAYTQRDFVTSLAPLEGPEFVSASYDGTLVIWPLPC